MTRSAWVVAAAAIGLAACGSDSSSGNTGGSNKPSACTPPATATVKFSTDVYPILTANCGTCHNDASTTLPKFGSASVQTSYQAVQGFVDTANPAQSKLLVWGNGGNMHPGGDRLSDTDTQKIQTWITECAQNN
ncbi:MAG TPA: hypothetical protein VF841_03790 [Anaeromyxobacter sp.]